MCSEKNILNMCGIFFVTLICFLLSHSQRFVVLGSLTQMYTALGCPKTKQFRLFATATAMMLD
jgi:hypothetical protein